MRTTDHELVGSEPELPETQLGRRRMLMDHYGLTDVDYSLLWR